MNLEHVAALARREWADPRGRMDYWAERYRADGPAPARDAATALYEHARRVRSSVFSDVYRADDFAHHQRLRAQLDRAARAVSSR